MTNCIFNLHKLSKIYRNYSQREELRSKFLLALSLVPLLTSRHQFKWCMNNVLAVFKNTHLQNVSSILWASLCVYARHRSTFFVASSIDLEDEVILNFKQLIVFYLSHHHNILLFLLVFRTATSNSFYSIRRSWFCHSFWRFAEISSIWTISCWRCWTLPTVLTIFTEDTNAVIQHAQYLAKNSDHNISPF